MGENRSEIRSQSNKYVTDKLRRSFLVASVWSTDGAEAASCGSRDAEWSVAEWKSEVRIPRH